MEAFTNVKLVTTQILWRLKLLLFSQNPISVNNISLFWKNNEANEKFWYVDINKWFISDMIYLSN